MVKELYREYVRINCMRDATRGGVAAALNEIARVKKIHIRIDEEKVPVEENVRACRHPRT